MNPSGVATARAAVLSGLTLDDSSRRRAARRSTTMSRMP